MSKKSLVKLALVCFGIRLRIPPVTKFYFPKLNNLKTKKNKFSFNLLQRDKKIYLSSHAKCSRDAK